MFVFPSDWLAISTLESRFESFEEALVAKQAIVDNGIASVRSQAQEKVVFWFISPRPHWQLALHSNKVQTLHTDWLNDRPSSADVNYTAALDIISAFRARVMRLEEDQEKVSSFHSLPDLMCSFNSRSKSLSSTRQFVNLLPFWVSSVMKSMSKYVCHLLCWFWGSRNTYGSS